MSAKLSFTADEDMAMWRFALEEHPGYGKVNMWELFKKTTGSKRNVGCLYTRFQKSLFPNLWKTKFHVETKLKLCQKYDVKVDDAFLKELKKDAEVDLNEDGTVNSHQLKPNCPKNRDLEMDDEEFKRIMSLIPKWKQWTSEEEAKIWSYVLENLEKYTRGSETFWTGLIAKMNCNRTPRALITRFLNSMAPNLHQMDFPIEQKLELYKKCQIPVDETYLKTLKEHAELRIDENRCITKYKMKTGRPEKRKNAEGTSGHVKKAKRVVSKESSDDQDEDEDVGFVPETDTRRAKKAREESPEPAPEAQEEEDDVILDNVVDRGWTNPDMVIRRPTKIEIDDDEDEPAVEELDDMFIPKEELFDEMDGEYAEMVHNDGGQEFGENSENFEDIPLNDDYSRVVDQRRDEQSDSMTKMLEIMQRMEQKMEIQEAAHMKALSEMKKDLEASHKEDMSEVKKALETSQHQVGELSKTVASMQSQAENQSSAMSSLQSEMQMIRNEMKTGSPDHTTTSAMKKFLLNFKNFVSSLESPELAPVEQRIDTALQNLHDSDQRPPPTTNLRSIFEVALTAIGH